MTRLQTPPSAPSGQDGNGSRHSILGWLTLLGVGSAAIALLGASTGFVMVETIAARRATEAEISLLAEVVGANSAPALAFFDARAANSALLSLRSDPRVRMACLYDLDGKVFAAFASENSNRAPDCPGVSWRGSEYAGDRLLHFQAVRAGDERVGALHLEVHMETLATRLLRKAGVVLLVLAMSAVAAALFAISVQRRITGPIRALVESSRALARGELSVIPQRGGAREVDALAHAFGEMAHALRDLVSRVRESTDGVSGIVEALGKSSHQMAADARTQHEAAVGSTRSMEHIAGSIQEVVASADVLLTGAEETAQALQLLDASTAQVSEHADGLASEVDITAASVSELTASIETIVGRLTGLQHSAGSTVSLVDDLRTSVESVRVRADRSEEISARTLEEAQRGRDAVGDTIGRIHEIRESFSEIERVVGDLSLASESIEEMVDLINRVADQTSLLALNAAIIASQAGKHGQAFGVVAQEVSELAESTTRSAGEIKDLVLGLKRGTRAAVDLVGRGAARVQAGARSSEEAGQVLVAIADSARDCAGASSDIAQATERQAHDLGELARAAAEVGTTSEQIASATSQQRSASEGILETTERLRHSSRELERLTSEQRAESERVENVRQEITAIAQAASAQSADSEQIKEALATFREGADLAMKRADDLEQVIAALATRSDGLQQAVSRFRLPDGNPSSAQVRDPAPGRANDSA